MLLQLFPLFYRKLFQKEGEGVIKQKNDVGFGGFYLCFELCAVKENLIIIVLVGTINDYVINNITSELLSIRLTTFKSNY